MSISQIPGTPHISVIGMLVIDVRCEYAKRPREVDMARPLHGVVERGESWSMCRQFRSLHCSCSLGDWDFCSAAKRSGIDPTGELCEQTLKMRPKYQWNCPSTTRISRGRSLSRYLPQRWRVDVCYGCNQARAPLWTQDTTR